MHSKYPTSFSTYDEFKWIFQSIPKDDCMEWTENLCPKLLWVHNSNGWTVAHALAEKGLLPEKFILSPVHQLRCGRGHRQSGGRSVFQQPSIRQADRRVRTHPRRADDGLGYTRRQERGVRQLRDMD